MRPGARTPEELETLFEDAFVVRDREALAELFEDGAVLVAGGGPQEARGGEEIARFATAMWERDRTYVADPRRVLQARDTALVVASRGINVRAPRTATAPGGTRSRSWTSTTRPKGGAMTQQHESTQPTRWRSAADEGEARWWFGAPRRDQGDGGRHRRPDDDHRDHRAARRRGAAARPSPRGRGLLDPRGRRHVRGRRHDDRGAARATTPSARATSRTATRSATPAAGCCSSSPPAASRSWSGR